MKKSVYVMVTVATMLVIGGVAFAQTGGSLKITIEPQEAIDQGAKWRRLGTEVWYNSGDIETNIPRGNHNVEFLQLEGWYNTPGKTVNIRIDSQTNDSATYSPKPIPGPAFYGCRLMNYGTQPYQKLPVFDIMQLGGPVLSWPDGRYDFCAYMDTIYCSLPAVASQWDDRLRQFADLVQCLYADINGPLNMEEDVPFTPNGIPDGEYELGVVASVLNNPAHPLHVKTKAAFKYNFVNTKNLMIEALSLYEGDIRSIVRLIAPHLPSAVASILSAFAILGEDQTYDSQDE